ncbi:hypothetical protein M4C14_26045 [Klebsiella pneumoniae]|nr:hypothetical protein [Klebsiella pneumoniae]
MNEQFLDKFDRAFIADPTEALKAVDDMATSLMSEIEQKRKAGIKELDPIMVKLQEDHAYLSGLHEEKSEELALHQRLHKQAGIEIDNPFKQLTEEAPAVFNEFDIQEDVAPAPAPVAPSLMTNDDIAKLAKAVSDKQAPAAPVEPEGMDISQFKPEPKPLDLSGLDTFTMRKAEEAKQKAKPKVDTDELDNFSNRYAGNSFIEKVTKKLQETFSATSHAPVNFVPEHEIKAMFGNSLSKIVNNNNSRSIHFVDKSVLKEDAQGLSIATKDRTLAARRLTLMAKAKGWSSISFDGNQLFLEEAYEEATRAGLVVKPSSEEQARFFKEVHEAKKLDSFMPFGGMKESKKKDIDKDMKIPDIAMNKPLFLFKPLSTTQEYQQE